MDQPVTFLIGGAAKASELSVKTIRYYEEIGLVPKPGRTNGSSHTVGRRVYTAADIGRLRLIHHARLLGLGLADIRQILAVADRRGCVSGQPEYRQILQRHLDAIDQRVRHLMGLRAAMEDLLSPARDRAAQKCASDECGCMRPANRISYVASSSIKVRKREARDA